MLNCHFITFHFHFAAKCKSELYQQKDRLESFCKRSIHVIVEWMILNCLCGWWWMMCYCYHSYIHIAWIEEVINWLSVQMTLSVLVHSKRGAFGPPSFMKPNYNIRKETLLNPQSKSILYCQLHRNFGVSKTPTFPFSLLFFCHTKFPLPFISYWFLSTQYTIIYLCSMGTRARI